MPGSQSWKSSRISKSRPQQRSQSVKKKPLVQPKWDDTSTDMTRHKLSKTQLLQKHLSMLPRDRLAMMATKELATRTEASKFASPTGNKENSAPVGEGSPSPTQGKQQQHPPKSPADSLVKHAVSRPGWRPSRRLSDSRSALAKTAEQEKLKQQAQAKAMAQDAAESEQAEAATDADDDDRYDEDGYLKEVSQEDEIARFRERAQSGYVFKLGDLQSQQQHAFPVATRESPAAVDSVMTMNGPVSAGAAARSASAGAAFGSAGVTASAAAAIDEANSVLRGLRASVDRMDVAQGRRPLHQHGHGHGHGHALSSMGLGLASGGAGAADIPMDAAPDVVLRPFLTVMRQVSDYLDEIVERTKAEEQFRQSLLESLKTCSLQITTLTGQVQRLEDSNFELNQKVVALEGGKPKQQHQQQQQQHQQPEVAAARFAPEPQALPAASIQGRTFRPQAAPLPAPAATGFGFGQGAGYSPAAYQQQQQLPAAPAPAPAAAPRQQTAIQQVYSEEEVEFAEEVEEDQQDREEEAEIKQRSPARPLGSAGIGAAAAPSGSSAADLAVKFLSPGKPLSDISEDSELERSRASEPASASAHKAKAAKLKQHQQQLLMEQQSPAPAQGQGSRFGIALSPDSQDSASYAGSISPASAPASAQRMDGGSPASASSEAESPEAAAPAARARARGPLSRHHAWAARPAPASLNGGQGGRQARAPVRYDIDEDDGEAEEVESSPESKARPAAQRPGRRQLPSRSGPGTSGMRGGQQLQRSPQGIAAGPGPIKHSLALSAFASP